MVELEAEGTIYFAFALLGKPESLNQETTYNVEGVTVRYRGAVEYRGVEQPDVMQFLVETAAATTLVEFAKLLVRLGREHLERLKIDGEEVPLNEEDILDVLRQAQGDAEDKDD